MTLKNSGARLKKFVNNMKIKLIAIGTKMPSWVTAGYLEYAERLPKDFRVELLEIPAQKRTKQSNLTALLKQEGEALLAACPKGSYVVALDRVGEALDTKRLASKLQSYHDQSIELALLIGGPEGIPADVLQRAQERWSLSMLTLPHPIVRIVVAEQIYRAWSLLNHHPYHR